MTPRSAMPKPRNPENKGLPARWQHKHGAYHYRVPPGLEPQWDGKQSFLLGKTLPEAFRVWADKTEAAKEAKTVGALLDRYALEVVPTKAPKTQSENARQVTRLRKAFGHLGLADIKPATVYQYHDKRDSKIAAKRELAVLSHAYSMAVKWGYLDKHPFKGEVRIEGGKPRTRYIEDWEIVECLALSSVRKSGSILAIQAYIRIKLLTGLRRGDLLRLRTSDIRSDGLYVSTRKTGKPVLYDITGKLAAAIEQAKAARPVDISPYLFCNKRGEGYLDEKTGLCSGWDSMWQRFMERVLTETKVTERFTEHDLRAKVGSDAESLERARQLLAHADSKITQRVYRRKPERVRPLK